jgi:hypothetical protein
MAGRLANSIDRENLLSVEINALSKKSSGKS